MHQSIRAVFTTILFLFFTVSAPAFADYIHYNRYFLAPDITTSGTSVNGVDVASGKLNRSDTDLSSSTLNFSRVYSGAGLAASSLGGWNHNYASQLLVNGFSYEDWRGIKSNKYHGKNHACVSGWNDIKDSLFNGQLTNATAKYRYGVCQISVSNKKVAEFIIHSTKKSGNAIVLSSPDGSTLSFVKSGRYWKTLSGAPFSLTRSGRNWKVSTPNDSIETYNKNGQLIRVTNASGQTTRLRYRGGKLTKVTGPFGKTLQLSYKNSKLDNVVGALGTVSYTYTGSRMSSVTKVDGSTMVYQYDGNKLVAVMDALGQTIASFTYDSDDRVATSAGQNNTREISYNYTNSVVTVSNVANNAADIYTFEIIRGVAKQSSMTDVTGSTSTQTYDDNGFPYESTASNGTITRTVYNERGLLVKRIESVGLASEKTTITHWHNKFRKPVLQVKDAIEAGNKATQSIYNSKGLLVKLIEGVIKTVKYSHHHHRGKGHHHQGHHHQGHGHKLKIVLKDERTARFSYNSKGQRTKIIAPNGAVILASYDKDGNRSGSANALNQESKVLSFDATGKSLVTEDANGIQTSNEYDSAGRLVNSITNGRTTSYEYDTAGRETKVTFPDGSTTTNEYDVAGNLVKTTDQDGNIRLSTFDSNGNQTSTQVTDDQGNVILSSSSTFNNKNQLIKSIDAQGNETTFEYDLSGNQVKVTDAKGNITQNQFDANNRLVKTIDALGGETVFTYDADGNRTSVTAPNGATTTFAYDSFNQITTEVSADRGTTSYQYDASGNQTQIIDANGNIKAISYDVLNRKTGESWVGAPDLTITYAYDSCANGVGKLCSVTDKSGSTSLEYDAKGQVVTKTQNIEGVVLTKTYVYNNEGKLISETYPSGAVISYDYNVDKISSISINGTSYISAISYNAADQLTGWVWADGTSYVRTYDVNGRLASFPLGNESRTLNYDVNGNITGWTDTGTDEAKTFAYDVLNRLTDYAKADTGVTLESQLFSYDANGNRTQLDENTVQTVYNILANSNRLTQVGINSYQYDANGNIKNDGEHTYSYDARDRLIAIDGTSTYLYNADNMRVKKTTPTGTILYGWDNDRIFAEYDENGNPVQETVYFGSTPVALLKDGQTYRIFADQIDTPRVLTDNANTSLWAWDSKPFGESAPNEDVDGDGSTLTYNLRFPGQYYDVETGKHYNFNRDYDPVTGRYIQSDPIGLDGGINTFGYVSNNSLGLIDPLGTHPTLTHGKWIDISLDIHAYNSNAEIVSVVRKFPKIKFTLYLYEENKDKIPYLKGALPGVVIGLHINPVDIAKKSLSSQVNDFYSFSAVYQPNNRTPVSIHGSASTRLPGGIMSQLASKGAPFVRTAASSGSTVGNPPLKHVIPATFSAIENFKVHNATKALDHYFTHPHEVKVGSMQDKNLSFFNSGAR